MIPRIAAEARFVNHLVRFFNGQREVRQEALLRDSLRDADDVHGAKLAVLEVAHFVHKRGRRGAPLRFPLLVHLARCHETEKVTLDFLRGKRQMKTNEDKTMHTNARTRNERRARSK